MANTRYQHQVERWVRDTWMPTTFGMAFAPRKLRLRSGGVFDFDAVSPDEKIVANISTSARITSGGKHGSGKANKLRADMLFLLLAPAERRIMVLTEPDMYAWCSHEREVGRAPREIEFMRALIPPEMAVELQRSRERASQEVRAVKVETGAR